MKYLITGGAGFIGTHLAETLLRQGHEVVVVDDLSIGKKENVPKGAILYKQKIQSPEFADIVKKNKPNGIFHLAAIPRVPVSLADPVGTTDANITGTVNVFKAAADNNVARVVFASSSSVYGETNKPPFREDMQPDPISPYAFQKLAGEKFATMFGRYFNLPVICLRYFNVYGPGLDPESEYSLVLGKFLKLKSQNKPLTIFGDGEQTRGFTYVDDVVDATIRAMESDKLKGGEIINIGAEKGNSVNELADLIGGPKEYLPPRAGDIPHTAADITKARQLLDWELKVSFNKGIAQTIEWFDKYYE